MKDVSYLEREYCKLDKCGSTFYQWRNSSSVVSLDTSLHDLDNLSTSHSRLYRYHSDKLVQTEHSPLVCSLHVQSI